MEGTKMKCPKCQFENPEGIKFCGECGVKLERLCPRCNSLSPSNYKFCGECGESLLSDKEIPEQKSDTDEQSSRPFTKQFLNDVTHFEGERKHVSVLFSDLTGYTVMSERLDPEEVKDITTHIFDEISKIIGKYEGFIEKFAGDAVMALFGADITHEDDPVRAIRAAREIHQLLDSLSPQYEERIGRRLSMHTGINTGLVVTGDVNLKKGTHGVAGDAINIASRLSQLANDGEILVSSDTYRQTESYFVFDCLDSKELKGKTKPMVPYRVVGETKIQTATSG
jgi:class 3 adenylate cyclase